MKKYKVSPGGSVSRGHKYTATLVITVEAKEEFMLDQLSKDIAESAMQLGAIRVDQTTLITISEKMDHE